MANNKADFDHDKQRYESKLQALRSHTAKLIDYRSLFYCKHGHAFANADSHLKQDVITLTSQFYGEKRIPRAQSVPLIT